jgi:hypothetical protein
MIKVGEVFMGELRKRKDRHMVLCSKLLIPAEESAPPLLRKVATG